MPVNDDLGTRMKNYYEQIPKTRLMRRTPVAIRIDGRAFHTFTKGFNRPFDDVLIKTMQETTKYLCENIQGCVLGYTQSDEITLILTDYKKFTSQAWFDYEVQKMCSIATSMATMAFNRYFNEFFNKWGMNNLPDFEYGGTDKKLDDNLLKLCHAYDNAIQKGAMFDARCFNIPKEEVTNLIYWRQLDATRNSIQMVGQANFSHTELHGKTCNDIQDMLMLQKGINWNDYPTYQKRGSCCVKKTAVETQEVVGWDNQKIAELSNTRTNWGIDTEIPIFKGEGREYIDRLIEIGDNE